MLYAVVRDEIRDGDLLLFRGKRLWSWIIKWWTRSIYSHVAVACWVEAGGCRRLMALEAIEGTGVRVYPLSEHLERGQQIDWYALTDPEIDRGRVVCWGFERVGHDYATARQLRRAFVTRHLCALLGLPAKVDQDRWFCSWFALAALLHGSYRPAGDDQVAPHYASPGCVSLLPCVQRRGPLTLDPYAD